jgi:hypothetical protein
MAKRKNDIGLATVAKTEAPKKQTKLEGNLEELRKILSVDSLFDDVDADLALEFLDAVETDFATEKQELEDALKDAEAEIIDTKDFKAVLKVLEEMPDDDIDCDELITVIENVDPEALCDHFTKQGYACIKCETLAQQQKLEEFLKTELFPLYSDQNTNMFM